VEEKQEKMTSLFGYKWDILNEDQNLSAFEKILKNRDLKPGKPEDFPDMEKAASRIKQAIKNQERIMVFGDYDADGITATAILVRALRELGAEVSYRIPHREKDGYGLSEKFIDQFIEAKVKLIITVDCGIACPNEVKKAHKNGIDTIVTDHHEIPLKPAKPYTIIHSDHLAGAGIAYRLTEALIGDAQNYIDLAAIGTIADVVPLTYENRTIASLGLKQMAKTKWPGLKALKRVAQVNNTDLLDLDSDAVGYRIGPRINAAGRLSDPYLSLQLLISDDEKAEKLAQQLNQINTQRQEFVRKILEDLEYDENQKIIFAVGDWPKGVLGLIAGRITEETNKPSIAMAEKEGIMTGSARSPEYFDITKALKQADKFLKEYGGHRKAAGLNLKEKNYSKFQEELIKTIDPIEIPPRKLQIDCELTPEEFTPETISKLEELKPFGEGNPAPCFLLRDVHLTEVKKVGASENHLKLRGKFGDKSFSGIKFNVPEAELTTSEISLAAKIKKDNYAKEGYSFLIEDIKVF